MKPTWLFGSVRYRTTMGTKYLEKAAGKLGRLSCKNMAMLGTCSISSARTVGSEHTHKKHKLTNIKCVHYVLVKIKSLTVFQKEKKKRKKPQSKKIYPRTTTLMKRKKHLPPSSDILATVSMTLIKSFSLSLNSRSTSSRPRATICLESNRSLRLVDGLPIPTSAECIRQRDRRH